MKHFLFIALIAGALACSSAGSDPDPEEQTGSSALGKGQPGVTGLAGISAWDNLSATEKARVRGWSTLFMHQSVGGDLEDGSANNGFRFEYFDLNEKPKGLSGNVFSAPNGTPTEKIQEFKRNVLAHKALVQIAIFKFGYADIHDGNLEEVKAAYKSMIEDLRVQVSGLRFVHITPPLITIVTKDEGNAAKMRMAQWMKDSFKDRDVIFELQEIESNNGACKLGNVWTLCAENRSTTGCPSKNQGVDAPEGQGHLCEAAATKISKAFLMSIYHAGK